MYRIVLIRPGVPRMYVYDKYGAGVLYSDHVIHSWPNRVFDSVRDGAFISISDVIFPPRDRFLVRTQHPSICTSSVHASAVWSFRSHVCDLVSDRFRRVSRVIFLSRYF